MIYHFVYQAHFDPANEERRQAAASANTTTRQDSDSSGIFLHDFVYITNHELLCRINRHNSSANSTI